MIGAGSGVIQIRHISGLMIVAVVAVASRLACLQGDVAIVRNCGVLIFDAAFILPLVVASCRRARAHRRTLGSPGFSRSDSAVPGQVRVTSLQTIALLSAAAFGICYAMSPTVFAQPGLHALPGITDPLCRWIPGIARIEHRLVAAGRPNEALLTGFTLAMLWLVVGLFLLGGFLTRWSGMTPERARWIRASHRARFCGQEVVRKVIDRGIVVMFVWNLPLDHAADADLGTAFATTFERLDILLTGFRGGLLMFLCLVLLEWVYVELQAGTWRFGFAGRHHRA